jgi:mono/diheme cytochrome c family protein
VKNGHAAIALLVGLGLSAAGSSASAQSFEAGRKIFEQRCATCHGGGGDGGGWGP